MFDTVSNEQPLGNRSPFLSGTPNRLTAPDPGLGVLAVLYSELCPLYELFSAHYFLCLTC